MCGGLVIINAIVLCKSLSYILYFVSNNFASVITLVLAHKFAL